MKLIPIAALTMGSLLLGACGGGGGGDAAPAPAPVTASVTITSSNQTAVARATVDGGLALGQSQPLDADGRASAQSLAPAPGATRISLLQTALRRALTADFAPRRSIASASARPLAVDTETEPCPYSGSMTLTADDRDNSQTLSAGDSLSISFNQCRETASELINGTMAFTVGSVAADTATRTEFSGSLAFQQLSVVAGSSTAGINGSVSFSALATQSSIQVSMTVGSGGLTVATTAPYSDSVVFESGMQVTINESLTTPYSTVATLNGSLTATSIGGRITVATLQPLTQLPSDAHPRAGQVRVTGAAGSQLLITVIDNTQVRLELDAAGDGTYETSTVVAWGSLRA